MQSNRGNMVWVRSNLMTILLTALLGLCAAIGSFYIQELNQLRAKVNDDHEPRIRLVESGFVETKKSVENFRDLLDERTENIIKEIKQISDHLISRMDQQHEFIKEMIGK